MTKLSLSTFLFSAVLFGLALSCSSVAAQEFFHKMDDSVQFTVSAEDWVTTKTARVVVTVEAAVSDKNAGTMRNDMIKTVGDLIKADWKLTSFNRSMDQTGLERWSTSFEARVSENELNGLADNAKKASKAGMQLTVSEIDFSPTLDETETAKSSLRARIYKQVNDQLALLNASLPGRSYRIATIDFLNNAATPFPRPQFKSAAMLASAVPMNGNSEPEERAVKVTLSANVVLAAVPPAPQVVPIAPK